LDIFKSFDDKQKGPNQSYYISHYNLLSLINLPKLIDWVGSLCNIWEGGCQGEGFIELLKTELRPGLIKRWEKWSIDNILIDSSIDHIYSNISNNNNKNNSKSYMDQFNVYHTEVIALNLLSARRPISGFISLTVYQRTLCKLQK
jgi:hypothetical protein